MKKYWIGCFLALACPLFSHEVRPLWEITETLWSLGIASSCDVGLNKDPKDFFAKNRCETVNETVFRQDIEQLSGKGVVWMTPCFLPRFCKEYLPKLKRPVVLVISGGDLCFPYECKIDVSTLVRSNKIIHIFAQNYDNRGEEFSKISHLPIGLDFHSLPFKSNCRLTDEKCSPRDQERDLKEVASTFKRAAERKLRAFVDFQMRDSIRVGRCKRYLQFGEDRTDIFNKILPSGVIDYSSTFMSRKDLWKTKGEYAFSVSPHGNGLDCHRTWEDLVLGCIVIVKTSPLDPLYEGLPVVIVDHWEEITEENMQKWVEQYGDYFERADVQEKLTNAYWINQIHLKLKD